MLKITSQMNQFGFELTAMVLKNLFVNPKTNFGIK